MTGHNTIKMTDLVALYRKLGFGDAETYIQSGNVVFNIPENQSLQLLSARIEEAILKKFNYNIKRRNMTSSCQYYPKFVNILPCGFKCR